VVIASAPAAGRSVSPYLGVELGKSGSATTCVASESFGADAHMDYESVAGRGLNDGVRRKKRLWGQAGRAQLESFVLAPWASRRQYSHTMNIDTQAVPSALREANSKVVQLVIPAQVS
jgi:hypothetical protein